MTKKEKRNDYFSFPIETQQFDKAMTELIGDLSRIERTKIIPVDNVMRYSHGIKWVSVSSDSSEEENEMDIHTTETIIDMKDIRRHNLQALPDFLSNIVKGMNDTFQKIMYQTISESCEKSGNSISRKDYETNADAFLATLKKIEFGVDKEGKVSLPEFHVGSGALKAFQQDAEAKGEEFQKEVDAVIEQKSAAALEREAKRIARFKSE